MGGSRTRRWVVLGAVSFVSITVAAVLGAKPSVAEAGPAPRTRRVAVLLVNHGSRSETWRKALLELGERVRQPLMAKGIHSVRTAFMEYTEPSIATRLRELDAEGVTDVILVPVFLTVSPHSFDDIPTIIGTKEDPRSVEMLKVEHIERYTPRARVTITPLLDFTDLLRKNVLRRVKALSREPSKEGLVLIAYGDETYEQDWVRLLTQVAESVRSEVGITASSHGWCGHIAHYRPEQTSAAIEEVLATKDVALVVPVLVAYDEMFQVKIIGGGVSAIPDHPARVRYRPDAILPDPDVEAWVLRTALEHHARLQAPVTR